MSSPCHLMTWKRHDNEFLYFRGATAQKDSNKYLRCLYNFPYCLLQLVRWLKYCT